MDAATQAAFRQQLTDRRQRLERAAAEVTPAPDLLRLLREVDAALKRMDTGLFGRCEACKEEIEPEVLTAKPLIPYCLCALSPEQQNRLQMDLELASRIQWALLPKQDLDCCG
jgi:RNA polymerase-binding transcription factor DksA